MSYFQISAPLQTNPTSSLDEKAHFFFLLWMKYKFRNFIYIISMQIFIYECVNVYCASTFMHIYMYMHMYVNMYVNILMCICVCVCLYF